MVQSPPLHPWSQIHQGIHLENPSSPVLSLHSLFYHLSPLCSCFYRSQTRDEVKGECRRLGYLDVNEFIPIFLLVMLVFPWRSCSFPALLPGGFSFPTSSAPGAAMRDDGDNPGSSFCFFPYKFPLIPLSPPTPAGSGHSLPTLPINIGFLLF